MCIKVTSGTTFAILPILTTLSQFNQFLKNGFKLPSQHTSPPQMAYS